jgi:hypothetical protein
MKGTDVTDAQLAHAQEFLRSAAGGKFDPEFMESQKYVTVDKEDIIRLLAWYGAIRAKGGRETPAPLVHRTGPGSTMDFGTPEQLAEMPTPQPVGKIMLAAKDLSPEALDSGATAELCARDISAANAGDNSSAGAYRYHEPTGEPGRTARSGFRRDVARG